MLACYIQWRKEHGLTKLTQKEARDFVVLNCIDLHEKGFDYATGYGLFVMPKLEDLEKTLIKPTQPQEPEIIINPPSSPSSPTPEVEKPKYWRCQAGAYSIKSNAESYQQVLKSKGYSSYIVLVNGLYKNQLGAFGVESNARNFSEKLKSEGINNFVVYY
jgi:cell division protein FtsN